MFPAGQVQPTHSSFSLSAGRFSVVAESVSGGPAGLNGRGWVTATGGRMKRAGKPSTYMGPTHADSDKSPTYSLLSQLEGNIH